MLKRVMNKRGIAFEELAKWIITLAVLVILVVSIIVLKAKGINLLDRFMEVFRFGR